MLRCAARSLVIFVHAMGHLGQCPVRTAENDAMASRLLPFSQRPGWLKLPARME